MILPTKHIQVKDSLLGRGNEILARLRYRHHSVSSLWGEVKQKEEFPTYESFILALDFLFTIGAIEVENGLIRRCNKND